MCSKVKASSSGGGAAQDGVEVVAGVALLLAAAGHRHLIDGADCLRQRRTNLWNTKHLKFQRKVGERYLQGVCRVFISFVQFHPSKHVIPFLELTIAAGPAGFLTPKII